MEICVLWPDKLGSGMWIMWKDIALVIFAMTGLVAGTYSSLLAIFASMTAKDDAMLATMMNTTSTPWP